jgi:hypothetical protein
MAGEAGEGKHLRKVKGQGNERKKMDKGRKEVRIKFADVLNMECDI